jgi:arginyl-tRNA synthetase
MSTSAKNLTEFCQETLAEILKIRDRVRSERQKRGYVEKADFLAEIRKIVAGNGDSTASAELEKFEIQFVDRAQFAADVTFRSTELIRADKNRYLTETCPTLAKTLTSVQKDGVPLFENVEQKGIYVNAKFAPEFLFSALSAVESQGEKFGQSSIGKGQDIVIDYSSPNAAKHLHAGHIR